MNMRKVTSLTALTSFVLLMVTSVILYIVPSGRVAYWAGYRLWSLSKEDWGAVHINLGFLLLISILLHVYYNWTPMISYMKDKSKKMKVFTPDFNVSLVVTLIVFFGTLAGLPPMSSIIHLGEAITDKANLVYGEPPYGHAELSPFRDFTDKVKVDLEESLAALAQAGISVKSPESTMKEIADSSGTTPQRIFDIIKPNQELTSGAEMPEEAPGGMGNRTVLQICKMYQLDLKSVLAGLSEEGIVVEETQTMKAIASVNSIDPHAVYKAIYTLQK